jgi:two-component system, OmpR family, sensor histidine kinase CpxA
MKIRIPLYGRILGWFLLNLALLATLGAAFWWFQAPWALDAIWNSAASGRMEFLASAVGGELALQPREDWTATLQRFSDAYGTHLSLFSPDGEWIAGDKMNLPTEVRARLHFPRNRRGPELPEPDAPPPGMEPSFPPPDMEARPPRGDGPPPRGEGPPRRPAGGRPPRAKFVLHAGQPPAYWAGARLHELARKRLRGGAPVLLLMADSLWGGPLLDWEPWLMAAAAAVLLSGLIWAPFARGITASIGAMARATERMANGDFSASANVRRGDELGRLADSINRLSGRLEHYVNGQRRFLGDVAHELCSPLARLELSLEIAGRAATDAQRLSLEDAREELRLMAALVEELLAFSKAGLRGRDVVLEIVEVSPLLADVVNRESPENSLIRIEAPKGLAVRANPELLRRAVGNLVRNALRHGDGSPVAVSAGIENGSVVVRVADEGPGVPEDALKRLGEPFYRPDDARTRESGGVGLGLAIVKACAEACGGAVRFSNRTPHGFEAELRLPRSPDAKA